MKDPLAPLIEERAPWLRDPRATQLRKGLEGLLRYEESLTLARAYRSFPADAILRQMAQRIAKRVVVQGLEHIPAHGPALVVANHPTGIADGLILWHLISRRRSDVYFYANRDILRVLPQLISHIIPVEWRHEARSFSKTRATLDATRHAVEAGRLGVIFPSGRLAKRRGLRLEERPWMHSAAMIARRFEVPVIPVHIGARNSALFYALDMIHPTLRDITLFFETLNKDRQKFDLRIGTPIHPRALPKDMDQAIAVLRKETLRLGQRPARVAPWPRRAGVMRA